MFLYSNNKSKVVKYSSKRIFNLVQNLSFPKNCDACANADSPRSYEF